MGIYWQFWLELQFLKFVLNGKLFRNASLEKKLPFSYMPPGLLLGAGHFSRIDSSVPSETRYEELLPAVGS